MTIQVQWCGSSHCKRAIEFADHKIVAQTLAAILTGSDFSNQIIFVNHHIGQRRIGCSADPDAHSRLPVSGIDTHADLRTGCFAGSNAPSGVVAKHAAPVPGFTRFGAAGDCP